MSEFLSQTMVVERLCGVGSYVALLFVACIALNGTSTRKERRPILALYLLAIVVLSFFFVPDSSKDLYRWLNLSRNWASMSFDSFFNDVVLTSDTPVAFLMIYFCRLTGFDGALPAFCSFVFFFNVFHIILDSSERYSLNGRDTSLVLLFVMCSGTLLEVISGVRSMVAFSMVTVGAYRELVEGKSMLGSLPLYLIASLIHLAAIPLVAIRLVSMLVFEKRDSKNLLINILIVVFIVYIAVTRGSGIIDASVAKAESYLTNKHYSYAWEVLNGWLKYGLVMYVFLKYRRAANRDRATDNITKLSLCIWVTGAACFFEYSIFHRFMVPMMIMAVPALSLVLRDSDYVREADVRKLVRSISVLILLLACARGDLSGFKFFLVG